MDELFSTTSQPMPQQPLFVGQVIHVNVRDSWLEGRVTSISHASIGVAYHRAPAARLRGAAAPWQVRPAEGVALRSVQELCRGDALVTFNGSLLTIAKIWQIRNQRWGIGYTTGTGTSVPAHAVLRVKPVRRPGFQRDHPPQVTLNGLPI